MAEVTYVSGPRVERVMGSDRRYTGEERIVLGIAYGKHQTMQLADLTEHDLIRIASGALDMLDKLRRERENEEP